MRRLLRLLPLWLVAACGPVIGDPCTTASDCAGQLCINRADLPGGYCSMSCETGVADSCPSGSACFPSGVAASVPSCFRLCAKNADCRTGYECKVMPGVTSPLCVGTTT